MKARILWGKFIQHFEYVKNRCNRIHNRKNKNTDMERLGRQYCLLYFVYLI